MNENQNRPYVVTRSFKSLKIALFLTLLFGPIGLMYVTMRGGIIMFFVDAVLFFTGFFILVPVINFICMIWVFKKIIAYNKNLIDDDLEE